MWVAVAIAAYSAYASYKSASAKADASRANAANLLENADYILEVNSLNTMATKLERDHVQGNAETQFAAGGFFTEAGALADISTRALREIEINTKQAEYQAAQMTFAAETGIEYAGNTEAAAKVSILGSALEVAGEAEKRNSNSTGDK